MLSALRQQKEDHNSHQHQLSEGSATAELLRLKDHLIDVEKSVRFSIVCIQAAQLLNIGPGPV